MLTHIWLSPLWRNRRTFVGDVQPKAPFAAFAWDMQIGLNGGCVRHKLLRLIYSDFWTYRRSVCLSSCWVAEGSPPQALTLFGGFRLIAWGAPLEGHADEAQGIFGTDRHVWANSPAPGSTLKRPSAVFLPLVGQAINTWCLQ